MEPRDAAPGPTVEPRWFDVDTAAQYLCMSRHALYHRVSRLQIPFVRHGRIVRFDRQALDRWMSKGVKNGFGEARRDLVLREANQWRGIDSKRDIDWTRGMVHVIGKFRKERDVPMQPDAQAALEEQLQEDGKL